MNLNSDDPLADLLSDNSIDNDNFFDNSLEKKSKNFASKENVRLEDIFGIKEEPELRHSTSTQRRSVKSSIGPSIPTHTNSKPSPITSTPRITEEKPMLSTFEDDDLGFDPQKPKAVARSNIFDNMLNPMEIKRPATTAPTIARREEKSISRQSTDTTTDTSNMLVAQSRPKTTGRRSSGASGIANMDPLGLFNSQAKEEAKAPTSAISTPKARKRGTTADWLGITSAAEQNYTSIREEQAESPIKPTTRTITAEVEVLTTTHNDAADVEHLVEMPTTNTQDEQSLVTEKISGGNTVKNILLLNSLNMETKNSLHALQHQESQLSLAAQMKKQEKALLEMQQKQDVLLQQQERQFQALLQQQLQRQREMEEHIKMQQQRINTHIQLMMAQPLMLPTSLKGMEETGVSLSNEHAPTKVACSRPVMSQDVVQDTVQSESNIKRLELEKLRLEDLVENMKSSYEREMELVESSYRKQLKMLEEHLNSIEARLRLELDEVKKHYSEKFATLEHEKQKLKEEYETDISMMKQHHEDELRKLKKSHEDSLEMLKEEHRRMLENVRQTKMLEFAAVQENGSYLETLRLASCNLENLSGNLQGLRDEMQMKIETLNKEKEKNLEARERKLEDAERRLKITEEAAEEEKRRLMGLVSGLEQQLDKLSKESAEENWLLRRKLSSLEAEKIAFEKEKECVREQMVRDEKRIADLKEQQLVETQRILLQLQEEKSRILVERAKIETERKLNVDQDLENQRLEMEAAVKVAQDATRQADAERTRYHRLQRQLEQKKRELEDKEHMLRAKEDELEEALRSFRLAAHKSQESEQKAQTVEQNFHMKIQLLQQRMRELGEKEANLSQERMLLTQDRLALQNFKLRLAERKCMLCKMGDCGEEIMKSINANGTNGGDGVPAVDVGTQLNGERIGCAEEKEKLQHLFGQGSIVDRMLDENIAESFRKMKATTNADFWTESVLDDDSKKLALNNIDNDLRLDVGGLLRKNSKNLC